jgi:hypothetical protein
MAEFVDDYLGGDDQASSASAFYLPRNLLYLIKYFEVFHKFISLYVNKSVLADVR